MSYGLPTSIFISSKEYHIRDKGDYRMVIDCFEALNDIELPKPYRIVTALMIFYEECNSSDVEAIFGGNYEIAVNNMFDFFNANQSNVGVKCNLKLIDWNKDSHMICAAVNNVAHCEIRSVDYLHWWTFLGYYMSVGESVLSTVVSIRDKVSRGKKLEKHEQKFKKDNPQYFDWDSRTVEQIENENEFLTNVWNAN